MAELTNEGIAKALQAGLRHPVVKENENINRMAEALKHLNKKDDAEQAGSK